jgi:hypothetical protein
MLEEETMQFNPWRSGVLGAALLVAIGCGQGDRAGSRSGDGKGPGPVAAASTGKKVHDHSGWWCDEHGVPEAECSMCSAKVAAEFKKKGDWCEKHERAKSQCFICDPSLEARFAALYEAKTGKKMPVPEDNRAPK